MWPWPQDKAGGAATATYQGQLDDEASPLLLHHKLTANDSHTAVVATNKHDSAAAAESSRRDEDSGPSTLRMLEATAKAPPVVLLQSSSSLNNKSKGDHGSCHAVEDQTKSSSALVMLVAMKERQQQHAGTTMKEDGMDDEKQATTNSIWQRYNRALETNPFFVKSVTAFFILALGDLCGQAVEHLHWHHQSSNNNNNANSSSIAAISITSSFEVDWPRTLRFGLLGLIGAPWSHLYFLYLDKYLPPTPRQPCSWITMYKLVIDQGLQAPAILAVMICFLAVMKGSSTISTATAATFSEAAMTAKEAAARWASAVAANVKADIQANYWTSLVANCKSCTNDLYIGFVSNLSHRTGAASPATVDIRRRGVHSLFFGVSNKSILMAHHGGGGGGSVGATNYNRLQHEHCYQHCLSSRPLQNLALDIVTGKLWIPASLVNLAFVKPTLRVLYVNVVFFAWTIILSMILNNDGASGE
jgi:Mpv17 / PMP22 family